MLLRTYEVTGISPQSRTVAQLLNGFVARGTLYPPLKAVLVRQGSYDMISSRRHALEIQPS